MSCSAVVFPILAALGWLSTHVHGAQVAVYSLDGSKIEGRITSFDNSVLVVETSAGAVSQAFEALDRVELNQPSTKVDGAVVATLVDGSSVVCKTFTGRDDRWTATSASGKSLEFPKGSVESLRMGISSPTLNREWLIATKETRASDEMVIVRPGDAIDRASGMIVGMTPETVEFSFDGQILQAPRTKLLGLFWYRSRERRVEPAIQVKMIDGSLWEASSLALDASAIESETGLSGLSWTTSCGVQARASWTEIQEINFSSANVVWLASQESLSKKTFQRSLLKESFSGRDALLGPRFFSANGRDDAKFQDLNFVGPGEISFRIPKGFQRFVAKVRRSEKTRFATTVRCEVWIGDDIAWKTTLAYDQLEAAVDIPVLPEKRLRIVVVCESDLLLGTQLSWQQPRLIR